MSGTGKRWLIACAVVSGFGLFGATSGQADDFDAWRDFDSRVQRGFTIAPVRLKLRGLNPSLVGLGSYIVNGQGGCNDCHTSRHTPRAATPSSGNEKRSTGLDISLVACHSVRSCRATLRRERTGFPPT